MKRKQKMENKKYQEIIPETFLEPRNLTGHSQQTPGSWEPRGSRRESSCKHAEVALRLTRASRVPGNGCCKTQKKRFQNMEFWAQPSSLNTLQAWKGSDGPSLYLPFSQNKHIYSRKPTCLPRKERVTGWQGRGLGWGPGENERER